MTTSESNSSPTPAIRWASISGRWWCSTSVGLGPGEPAGHRRMRNLSGDHRTRTGDGVDQQADHAVDAGRSPPRPDTTVPNMTSVSAGEAPDRHTPGGVQQRADSGPGVPATAATCVAASQFS